MVESRRAFLKQTAFGAAALAAPGIASAAPKPLTMMHESSFIPPFDAFFKNKLAAAYEKATGIKVNYDIVSVGGLLTRVTTAAENGTGPDMSTVGFNWAYLFDEKLIDVTDNSGLPSMACATGPTPRASSARTSAFELGAYAEQAHPPSGPRRRASR